MAICNPNDNVISPYIPPNVPIPRFGMPIAPVQLPVPDFTLPPFPEKLEDLIESLVAFLPGPYDLKAIPDTVSQSLMEIAAKVMNSMQPFVAIYNFIMPIFKLILCIIDVLCAIPKPLKIRRALIRLFKNCLPDFLRLFPQFALLALIMSIIALLIQIIAWIIAKIAEIIRDILENLDLWGKAATLNDVESTLAIAEKIASLLCILENILSVFAAFAAIWRVIETLAQIASGRVCSSDTCCDAESCPPFISENPEGVTSTHGQITYVKALINDGVIEREALWQLTNTDQTSVYKFMDILTPVEVGADIYWKNNDTYTSDMMPKDVPYLVDFTINNYNFENIGLSGFGQIEMRDVIVQRKPYDYIQMYSDKDYSNRTGTFNLTGGVGYYPDGSIVILNDNTTVTIEKLINSNIQNEIIYTDVKFTWRMNFDGLLKNNLVTLGCDPNVSFERTFLNNLFDVPSVNYQIPDLNSVDINGTQNCLSEQFRKLRTSITTETVDAFQRNVLGCLASLQGNAENVFREAGLLAPSTINSIVTLDPDLQFTSRDIDVSVTLYDQNRTPIMSGLTADMGQYFSAFIRGEATLGSCTSFSYDGYGVFNAKISSNNSGNGILQVYWNETPFQDILNSDNLDEQTTIVSRSIPYTFVGTGTSSLYRDADGNDSAIRRDERDVAND